MSIVKMKKDNDVFKKLGIKQKTIDLFSEILKELAPPPKLTIDQWADKYRILVLNQVQNQEDGVLIEHLISVG